MLRLVRDFYSLKRKFHADNNHFSFLSFVLDVCDTYTATRMDFIRYHYILVACSSTLVRRRCRAHSLRLSLSFPLSLSLSLFFFARYISECWMLNVVCIASETSKRKRALLRDRSHLVIHFISLHHKSIQSLCNLSSLVVVYVVFMYLIRLTLHIRQENVSEYSV